MTGRQPQSALDRPASTSMSTAATVGGFDRNGLEILDRKECLRLLATATLGRVGVSLGALPVILPVNFRLVGDRIVFRTGIGTKLDAATDNAVVAFEADEIEPFSHTGWSVTVTGESREVTAPDALMRIRAANLPRWAPTGDGRIVEVDTTVISGRRIVHGRRPAPGGL
jgi:uncharacterized protein